MSSQTCAYCGKTFEAKRHAGRPCRYCSRACAAMANRMRAMERTVEQRELSRRSWAADEAATVYGLAQSGIDKLEEYIYNSYIRKGR